MIVSLGGLTRMHTMKNCRAPRRLAYTGYQPVPSNAAPIQPEQALPHTLQVNYPWAVALWTCKAYAPPTQYLLYRNRHIIPPLHLLSSLGKPSLPFANQPRSHLPGSLNSSIFPAHASPDSFALLGHVLIANYPVSFDE